MRRSRSTLCPCLLFGVFFVAMWYWDSANSSSATFAELKLDHRFMVPSVLAATVSAAVAALRQSVWWAGYDARNCKGCLGRVDWQVEVGRGVSTVERRSFEKHGVAVLRAALSTSKVADMAAEADSLAPTFMTDLLGGLFTPFYAKYEHKLDTRSEMARDWAVHGPFGSWAAELLGVKEVRLYNAELIYHKGEDAPKCQPNWHRDTVAAPFPADAKSAVFNVYFENISADPPHGDGLIYVGGSHKWPGKVPHDVNSTLIEPKLAVGDVLVHAPNVFHSPSGRGCWRRRSLQFRYVEGGVPFSFDINRVTAPVAWTFAHSPGIAAHGLSLGEPLTGPWYPLVYPSPIAEEHHPLKRQPRKISTLMSLMKDSDALLGNESSPVPRGYIAIEGVVENPTDWSVVRIPDGPGVVFSKWTSHPPLF